VNDLNGQNRDVLVRKFWKAINDAAFDDLERIMKADTNIWLPNTREVFKGVEKYIRFNKTYPGRWYAEIESIYSTSENVITVVHVHDEVNTLSFFVNSIFSFSDDMISEIKEYWGDNGEPPQWRLDEKLSERY
jgi:ketosteroid isomerase-like protein